MAGGNKQIMGMDAALLDVIQTLNKYQDQIIRLPNQHQMLLKTLGPIYKTYTKVQMATDSVTGSFKRQTKTGGVLTKALKGLAIPLTLVLGLFKGLTMAIFPIVGMVMAILGVMMLFTAALDQGGGSLRAWLEEMPIISTVFGAVQTAVDVLKGVLSGEGGGGLFAPVFENGQKIIDELLALWETLTTSVSMPFNAEEIFGGIMTTLGILFTIISEGVLTSVTLVTSLYTALAESGAIQTVIDGISSIFTALGTLWGFITALFGDSAISDFFQSIRDLWQFLVDWLQNSGIFEFIGNIIALVFEIVSTIIVVTGVIIAVVMKIIQVLWPFIAPYAKMVISWWGIILAVVMGVVNTVIKVIRAALALLRGDLDGAAKIFKSIGDTWKGVWEGIKGHFAKIVDAIMDYLQPIIDAIDMVVGGISSVAGGIGGAVGGLLGFSDGGVAKGPTSGYPVALHGTEAVVPLPDGRSIPVTIEGMSGGGGTNNVNITLNGASGDPQKLARAISDEVSKAFRSRSRSGGFSRGV